MKFALLLAADGQDTERFARMTPDEWRAQIDRVAAWFRDNARWITGSAQLDAPEAAVTVRWDRDGSPVRHPGPFLPAGTVLGGYVEVDVDSLEDAVRIASSWPPRGAVEVRALREGS